jgi:hypothetical protein
MVIGGIAVTIRAQRLPQESLAPSAARSLLSSATSAGQNIAAGNSERPPQFSASTGRYWPGSSLAPGFEHGNWPGFEVVTFATTRQNEVSGCAESEALMPHRIAEQLLQVAKTCRRLAAESKDKDITRELEAVAADLSAKAKKLEDLYAIIEAT